MTLRNFVGALTALSFLGVLVLIGAHLLADKLTITSGREPVFLAVVGALSLTATSYWREDA